MKVATIFDNVQINNFELTPEFLLRLNVLTDKVLRIIRLKNKKTGKKYGVLTKTDTSYFIYRFLYR